MIPLASSDGHTISLAMEAVAQQERVLDDLIWQMSREIVVSTINCSVDLLPGLFETAPARDQGKRRCVNFKGKVWSSTHACPGPGPCARIIMCK